MGVLKLFIVQNTTFKDITYSFLNLKVDFKLQKRSS